MTMEFHPLCSIFPLMDGADFDALVSDIRDHGLIEPILTHRGKIVDGRNRYRACAVAGIEPRYEEWQGHGSLVSLVLSLNLKRRHLTPSQKAAIAVDLLPHLEKEARERQEATWPKPGQKVGDNVVEKIPPPTDEGKSRDQAAKLMGVNPHYVSEAKAISQASPETFGQLKAGEKTITQARREIVKATAPMPPPFPTGKYRVIYADPPWSYGNTQPDYHPEQRDHYPVMSLAEICDLPVGQLTEDNAVLFLWVTSPILRESFDVIRAWGFQYKASFVWDKVKHNMGHYNSVRHEFLLIAVKGSCQPDVAKLYDSVQSIERTTHSRKPPEFRQIIDSLYPHGKRLELFATEAIEGWETYGNQVYRPHIS